MRRARSFRYIEPSLAKQVAEGDACPISLLPMEDINPSFVPRALKTIPMNAKAPPSARTAVARPDKGKGRAKELPSEKPSNVGILKFFSPQVREAPATQDGSFATGPGRPAGASGPASPSLGLVAGTTSAMVVGKKSGKRTLAEVMDDDMAAKRKRQEEAAGGSPATATATPRMPTTSRFFHAGQRSVSDPRGSRRWSSAVAASTTTTRSSAAASAYVSGAPGSASQPVAGSSGLSCREKEMGQMHLRQEKENVPCEESADADDVDVSEDEDVDMGAPDAVTQEDGYMSPTESTQWNWDSPDISSPLRPGARRKRGGAAAAAADADEDGWEDGIDADVLSSSPIARTNAHTRLHMRKLPSMVVERVVSRPLPLRPVMNTSFSARNNRRKSLGGSSHNECKKKNKRNTDSEEGVDTDTDTDIDIRQGRGGPDLRDAFDDWDEITSGGEDLSEDDDAYVDGDRDVIDSTASSTPGPITPATEADEGGHDHDHGHTVLAYESTSEELEDEDVDEDGERAAGAAAAAARDATVAHGWWQRWARSSGSSSSASAGIRSGSGSRSGHPRPDPGGHRDRVRVFSQVSTSVGCSTSALMSNIVSIAFLFISDDSPFAAGFVNVCSVLLSGAARRLLVVAGHGGAHHLLSADDPFASFGPLGGRLWTLTHCTLFRLRQRPATPATAAAQAAGPLAAERDHDDSRWAPAAILSPAGLETERVSVRGR
ncbi:hypothetical protein C8Q74DRAFT_226216 [Fomes fomentarius]|nr:hypothetical protein C8Q74DRAFT_226216 [Fomes fomentarius]